MIALGGAALLSFTSMWAIYLMSPWFSHARYETLSTRQKLDWDARGPTAAFCAVVVPLAAWALGDPPLQDRMFGVSERAMLTCAVAVGYFAFDSLICIWHYREYGVMFLLHGLACLLVFTTAPLLGFLQYYAVVFLFYEASTPFTLVHHQLYAMNMRDNMVFKVNGIVMTAVFVVVRIVWGLKVSVLGLGQDLMQHEESCVLCNIAFVNMVVLNGLNIAWGYRMTLGCYRTVRRFFKGEEIKEC